MEVIVKKIKVHLITVKNLKVPRTVTQEMWESQIRLKCSQDTENSILKWWQIIPEILWMYTNNEFPTLANKFNWFVYIINF